MIPNTFAATACLALAAGGTEGTLRASGAEQGNSEAAL